MSEEWHRLNRQLERERRVRRMQIRIGILVIAIVLFSAGIGLLIHRLQNYDGGLSEVLLTETEGNTDSVMDSASGTDGAETESETETTAADTLSFDYEELSDLIEAKIGADSVSGTWSVYVKDLNADESISINNESMYAASLIKLFVMMSCYENMDDIISNYCTINHTDETTAASVIEDRLYTMIVFSRNESYNELVHLHSSSGSFTTGCRFVNSYIAENAFADTGVYTTLHPSDSSYETTGEGTNHTTVEDCGALLEAIYNGECVSFADSMDMLDLLLQQDVTTKIPAGVPDGIEVANKTGDTDDESHDVAIVFGEETDYILCVMSTGVEEMGVGNAETLIQEISALVYEFLNP
ncbi:MAG: class A beta-lactamase-related serine hydrolase [Lachnospiraceae bacterium]|nr:class A beta-lactamase-related serine hydrolase [Lachnospiraceae bacterium]